MKNRATLADSEWRLMQIIWDNPPRTYRQICDAACADNGWTRHAVISFLKRMETKGAIRVEDANPVKLYYPLLNKNDAICAETEEVLERVYNGNILLMMQSAASARELSDAELLELEALLKAGSERHE
ncbi:MAG: BlaI/MecI/CopY family transcriptional regulator [Clostridia bacterium]